MDVTLLKASSLNLPTDQRASVIVYDGTADMQLWPGPGADKDLRKVWGTEMQRALDVEVRQVEGRTLALGDVVRLAPGRLHCDWLAWVALREPEPGRDRSPAPSIDLVRAAVGNVLRFVAPRRVERVAFPILGGGPGEADPVARVVTIVRAAEAYHQACRAEGRAPGVEEVFVCAPDRGVYQAARRKLGMEAKAADLTPVAKKAAPARRRAASGGSRAKKPKGLDPNVAAQQRATAEPFSIAKTYAEGDFMNHKKFGVGRVEAVLQEGAIEVKFEDGSVRKMAHGRA